ncbi:MAG: acetate--CoA ligase family protein [Elusimicrobia bacterium]|nr:acetate--CoA ligase family protein [Elusimicrobiota bacterium]
MTRTKAPNPSDAVKSLESLFEAAHAEGRTALTEPEVYAVLKGLGLRVPAHRVITAKTKPALDGEAGNILREFPGEKVVLKIASSKTLHKTDEGAVCVVSKEEFEVKKALLDMRGRFPHAEGVLACEFVEHTVFSLGHELILGGRQDEAFGPVLSLGVGGTHAEEASAALKPGIVPAIAPLKLLEETGGWQGFLDRAWVWRYASGKVRGSKRAVEDSALKDWLEAFAKLLLAYQDLAPWGQVPAGGSKWAIDEIEVNPLAVSPQGLIALDGLLRFRPAMKLARVPPTAKAVGALLKPSSVAVAGVSEKMNMGRVILRNVISAGFDRSRLFVLKDHPAEIDGVRCFRDCSSFPITVDLLVVAVPSKDAPRLIRESAASGKVMSVCLISAGIGEKAGTENLEAQAVEALAEAKRINPDFGVNGGNSLGIISARAKIDTFFIPTYKQSAPYKAEKPGPIAFISQSGAFAISVMDRQPWLRPLYCVSVGNQLDISVVDYAQHVLEDEGVKVVLVYLEGFKPGDGLALARTALRAKRLGKTLVVYKGGRTPAGTGAAKGHTASLAGDFAVARSALSAAGALVAETFDDFDDLSAMALLAAKTRPRGGRAFFISNAGFEAVGMADSVSPKGPLKADIPGHALKERLAAVLKEFGLDAIIDVRNPLDVTPMANDAALIKLADAALSSDEVDVLLLSPVPLTPAMQTLPAGPGHPEDFLGKASLVKELKGLMERHKKPVLFCVSSGRLYDPYVKYAQEQGAAVFRAADRAARALARYVQVLDLAP